MGKIYAKVAFYSTFILFLLVERAVSRNLHYNAAELVSDGVSDGRGDESILRLNGNDSSEEECKLMYGFLPCSTNIPSHLFLIVIYEYLLYHGESYAGGDGRIFRVLGKTFRVSIFSQLLDSLPDSLILLATGLSCDQEKAPEYVVTGAGLLAGSSVLLLTLLWGTCFLFSRKKFTGQHASSSFLRGWGIHTDPETRFHAKVMFFSLIPFVIILFPSVFGISYTTQEHKIVLLVSLSAAVICLLSYFYYQYYDVNERISKRRLAYAEVEQKVEMHVPFYEVQALMLDREKHLMTKQKEMENKLNDTEANKESKMSKREFYEMFEEWIEKTRNFMDDPYSIDEKTDYNQVVELLLEDKDRWLELMTLMMRDAFGEDLHKKDGKPNESAIDRFFDHINTDKDEYITQDELKAYYQRIHVDDEIAEIIIRHLDNNRDGKIDKKEFRSGVGKWIASCKKRSQASNGANDNYHQTEAKAKTKEMVKAIILLIVGILMITVLAEPLVESVRQFSESVKIEPFYVSFILVPLATNARTAIAAIRAARQKRYHITSFTFSEIYHKVFLNNILGFCVLVSVIYFRGFTWHFSAEILVVVIVCIIMGLLASFKTKFPDWTLLIAFPLYPLSMVVVYFVNDAFQFT